MEKYCYSKDIVISSQKLFNEMDLEPFFKQQKSPEDIEKMLNNLGIYSSELDYNQAKIKIRMVPVKQLDFSLPNISNRYYDKDDKLFSEFSIKPYGGTLLSLNGEIYENLSLDEKTAPAFCKEHGYDEHIYPETTSLIHFRGVEYKRSERMQYEEMLQNMKEKVLTEREEQIVQAIHEKTKGTKDIYITKSPRRIMFYYNSPNIFDSYSSDTSLTVEEISKIQNRILELLLLNGNPNMNIDLNRVEMNGNDNEQFLEYAYAYLAQYRKIVGNKGYQDSTYDVIDHRSLEMIRNCSQGNYSELMCKITIISDTPIQTTEEKNTQFMKQYIENN